MKLTNEQTGKTIELQETYDISKLRSQLMLLGINGLFYSPWAREIQKKIDKLENEQNKN
jgi:hypothetical protein